MQIDGKIDTKEDRNTDRKVYIHLNRERCLDRDYFYFEKNIIVLIF